VGKASKCVVRRSIKTENQKQRKKKKKKPHRSGFALDTLTERRDLKKRKNKRV
jgi:hypothetical protein